MSSSALIRWGGLAAMLGGTLWVIGTLIQASKPRGCIAQECAFRPMRETGALDGILTLLAVLLLAVGAVGLVTLIRRSGRFGRAGKAGVLIGAVGAALLVIVILIQAMFYGGGEEFPLWPPFVITGLLALVVGFVLVGITILRAGVLPRWVAVLIIVGALAMLGFNDQTWRALMAIPFGVAWVAVGYVMWSGESEVVQRPARVR